MTIHIRELEFETIIGILKQERVHKQRVVIDVDIFYTKGFIDYAEVAKYIKQVMQESEFALIEDALSALSIGLKQRFENMLEIELKIMKPDILQDCKVGVSKKFNFS